MCPTRGRWTLSLMPRRYPRRAPARLAPGPTGGPDRIAPGGPMARRPAPRAGRPARPRRPAPAVRTDRPAGRPTRNPIMPAPCTAEPSAAKARPRASAGTRRRDDQVDEDVQAAVAEAADEPEGYEQRARCQTARGEHAPAQHTGPSAAASTRPGAPVRRCRPQQPAEEQRTEDMPAVQEALTSPNTVVEASQRVPDEEHLDHVDRAHAGHHRGERGDHGGDQPVAASAATDRARPLGSRPHARRVRISSPAATRAEVARRVEQQRYP